MNEIEVFQALAKASEPKSSDVSDIRGAVWDQIAAAGQALEEPQTLYASSSPWILVISAAALVVIAAGCMTGYYYLLAELRTGCINASYNDLLEQVFSVFWGGPL